MTGLRLDELARAFDDEFARPIAPRATGVEDLLAIRIAGAPYALARGQLAGLYADKSITALPGAAPGLLGISGFRGALIPVYDLRALLGVSGPVEPTRWLATAAAAPVALAFGRFDAFLRVAIAEIAAHAGAGADHAPRTVEAAGELRPILDVPSIVAAIRARVTGAS